MKKADCNCLKESQERFDKHLTERNAGYVPGSAHFVNVPMLMFDGSDCLPFMTIEYQLENIKKKREAKVFFEHCPFCGKKFKNIEA